MNYHLFPALTLLLCCSGGSSATLPDNILAYEGGDVILPCSFNSTANGDFPNVEWSKEGLDPNVVLLYRDGCETHEMKNPVFQFRTSLIPKELKHGNISLRISNVQLSDGGRYRCMTLWRNGPRDVTTVELVVGTVSEPQLSVVSVGCGGVTLQCEANYSLPEPEITFLDDQGHEVAAEEPKRDKDGRGNYTVRRRLTLHSDTNSITCRVKQPESHLNRDTEILIPADSMRFCFLTTIISVGGTVLVLEFVCGLSFCLWKIHGKTEKDKLSVTRRMSGQSSQSFEGSHVEQGNWTDGVGNSDAEALQREVAFLKMEIYHKDKTIQHLLSVSTSSLELTKPFSPRADGHITNPTSSTHNISPKPASPTLDMQRQNSNPAVGQRNNRRNSSPAALSVVWAHSSLSNSSKKKLGSGAHINSQSRAQPDHRGATLKRRHSLGISSTALSANRFAILGDLTEEAEPLI